LVRLSFQTKPNSNPATLKIQAWQDFGVQQFKGIPLLFGLPVVTPEPMPCPLHKFRPLACRLL
jgi:hypothetical protein